MKLGTKEMQDFIDACEDDGKDIMERELDIHRMSTQLFQNQSQYRKLVFGFNSLYCLINKEGNQDDRTDIGVYLFEKMIEIKEREKK